MRTLIWAMQSSGGSYVAYTMGQHECICIPDLWYLHWPSKFRDVPREMDIIVKATMNINKPIGRHIDILKPDRLVLVTRDVGAIRNSLEGKQHRDYGGTVDQKIDLYMKVLKYQLHFFDEIIPYERVLYKNPPIQRSLDEVVEFNCRNSTWCMTHWLDRWGLGGLKECKEACSI